MKKPLLTILLLLGSYITYAQDLIMLKTGDEIENVKVLDTLESVIYRNGTQAATIAKSDVLWIKYSNGTKVKLNANAKPAQTVVAPAKAEVPAKKAEPAPTVQTVPPAQTTPPVKNDDVPKDNKAIAGFLDELDKKLKSNGEANEFKPRGFGLGANLSLLGGESYGVSIVMPISFTHHFRLEPEFGFGTTDLQLSTFNSGITTPIPFYINPDYYSSGDFNEYSSSAKVSTYKIGLGVYGMTQRGRVNIYIGPSVMYTKAILGIEKDFQGNELFYPGSKLSYFQITPTVGAEYGLSNHFTFGLDLGLPIVFESYKTVFDENNNNQLIIDRRTKLKLLTRARFMLRFYF